MTVIFFFFASIAFMFEETFGIHMRNPLLGEATMFYIFYKMFIKICIYSTMSID